MNFEQLSEKVLEWGDDKGILVPENRFKQALKMVSEVGELCDSVIKGDVPEQKNELGDVLVTVIILAEQLGHDPVACLELAYDVIKGRTGKTVNGIFVKSDTDWKSLEIGDRLVAVDPCQILGEEYLVVGKSYQVTGVSNYGIEIKNESGDDHSFGFDQIKEFFTKP